MWLIPIKQSTCSSGMKHLSGVLKWSKPPQAVMSVLLSLETYFE